MIAMLQARADGLWARAHVRNNILAGLVVGVVALPLAMAFAIAPVRGLNKACIRPSWRPY
jgi:SulP family sulfate permease